MFITITNFYRFFTLVAIAYYFMDLVVLCSYCADGLDKPRTGSSIQHQLFVFVSSILQIREKFLCNSDIYFV